VSHAVPPIASRTTPSHNGADAISRVAADSDSESQCVTNSDLLVASQSRRLRDTCCLRDIRQDSQNLCRKQNQQRQKARRMQTNRHNPHARRGL